MNILNFKKKHKEGLEVTAQQLGKLIANSPYRREEHKYLVAIFWYDTKNVTNQRVAAYTKEGALLVIDELFKPKKENKDYGIVNIIEMN